MYLPDDSPDIDGAYQTNDGEVLYHQKDHKPELWKLKPMTVDDIGLPVIESLFKTKDGKEHPIMQGELELDFLQFGFWKKQKEK